MAFKLYAALYVINQKNSDNQNATFCLSASINQQTSIENINKTETTTTTI